MINRVVRRMKLVFRILTGVEVIKIKDKIKSEKEREKERREKLKEAIYNEFRLDRLNFEKYVKTVDEFVASQVGEDFWIFKNAGKYKGKRCFLLGNGPSLNDLDLSLLDDEIVMGVNGIYLKKDIKVDFLTIVAYDWWKDHVSELESFKCERAFLAPYVDVDMKVPTSIISTISSKVYERFNKNVPVGFSREAHKNVYIGGTVLNVCLQILYTLGFDEVILLGVDHNYTVKREEVSEEGGGMFDAKHFPHFSDKYHDPKKLVHVDYTAMENGFELSKKYFEQAGKRIINATPNTKLEVFDCVDYSSLFK